MPRRVRIQIALAAVLAAAACSSNPEPEEYVPPEPVPFPSMAFAGQGLALFPVTLMVAEEELGWGDMLRPREEGLHAADSVIELFLTERLPDVEWILPDVLRRAADQAPGMLPDPDHMGMAVLRAQGLDRVPDPLISELRNLTAVAGNRWAAVPASLVFLEADVDTTASDGGGLAVRSSRLSWSTYGATGSHSTPLLPVPAMIPGRPCGTLSRPSSRTFPEQAAWHRGRA